MRAFVVVLLVCCFAVGFAALAPGALAEDESVCAMCHEEVVDAFGRTAHAIAPGWNAATACENCHGPGDAHIDAGGDVDAIVRPQLLAKRESSDRCLECHRRHEGHFSSPRSLHRLNDVGCIDCHNPHSAAARMLVRKGADLCARCHPSAAARFELPRSHPMAEAGPGCASCHDPHATLAGPNSLEKTCGSCHFEKIGPFLYDHGPLLLNGCASCHEIHGSTNRHLLRHASQVNLCYECHSASVTPGWHSAPRYANEKCTACHAAIHGSNTSQFFLEE